MTPNIQKLVDELRTDSDLLAAWDWFEVGLDHKVVAGRLAQAADLITRLAGALERTQRVMVQLVEPDMSVPPASIYFEARSAELVARQALTGTPIKA